MKTCARCWERKDDHWFRDGQPIWIVWCVRCERTPIGEMPYRQEPTDRIDMKDWYTRKMIEAYHDGRFDDAMNYAKMAGIEPADIARIAEAEREILE